MSSFVVVVESFEARSEYGTQQLKQLIKHYLEKSGTALAYDQQESLDMICHKIARIVNGDPDYADSWVDIAGYAKLVADRLQGVER